MERADAGNLTMTLTTFEAQVIDGRLEPADALRAFEGRQVRVTLMEPASVPESNPTALGQNSTDSEPPEWLDVEKVVHVKISFEGETLRDAFVVEGCPLQPCIIVPEEFRDAD
jgi:hypothetical protein